jgi:hypothetical protein
MVIRHVASYPRGSFRALLGEVAGSGIGSVGEGERWYAGLTGEPADDTARDWVIRGALDGT